MQTSQELSEYLDEVSAANANAAIDAAGDRRLAINAIMTLGGFFGTLHCALFEAGAIAEKSDDVWKESLAIESPPYRVLRDAAYALKHGNLTHKKARLIRKPDKIFTMPASFDGAAFDRSASDSQTVWIETPCHDYRADERIKSVLDLARTWLGKIQPWEGAAHLPARVASCITVDSPPRR